MHNLRPVVTKTTAHEGLFEFLGEWDVEQRLFHSPGADPLIRKGKTTFNSIVSGLGSIMLTELEDENGVPFSSVSFFTWNVSSGKYEGYYLDTHSFGGFESLSGSPIANLPSSKATLEKHGIENANNLAVRRTWDGTASTPSVKEFKDGGMPQVSEVTRVPMRFIENKISNDLWVLLGCSTTSEGEELVVMENTYTRANKS
ncbi:hypothetical protein GCM10023189_40190 [Nibrella saemangeumensis]|uniref:Lipocalin-like domain-containing protein n=2 Tax=Nibrella saemangeumensis TaxID=1084526 RepID=A0ABP8NB37_9BACT